jgi:hypothetical protein
MFLQSECSRCVCPNSKLIVAAVDHRKRFIDLVVGYPGSVADGRIWANSNLNNRLEAFFTDLPSTPITTQAIGDNRAQIESIPAFILADSAYPSTQRVVPTFRTTECNRCQITKKLNRKLASVRYCIENAFGICKGRFRILNNPLECAAEDITRAAMLVVAVFTLHNFLIAEDDDTDIAPIEREAEEIVDEVADIEMENQGLSTRDILWRHIAWQEEA